MVYAAPFHRLVLMGTLFDDTFNTTLSIIRKPGTGTLDLPLPEDVLSGVRIAIEGFWSIMTSGGGAGIHGAALLTGFKLNQIGVDGKYTRPETTEYTWGSPRPGGGVAGTYPAQLATVATLRTDVPRGRGSKGRMFLPVCDGFGDVETDGRASTSAAQGVANAVRDFIVDINAAYAAAQSGDEYLGVVGVASNVGVGVSREVTSITVGRVTDTIRSRRNRQTEDPQVAAIP